MANRFWNSMSAALKRPTVNKLYKRLRDLDYIQVDERMAVMLNAILQLEAQGECRESATETVLTVGYTTEKISNKEQTRWLSWNVDGGVRKSWLEQQHKIRRGRIPTTNQTTFYDTVTTDGGSISGPH